MLGRIRVRWWIFVFLFVFALLAYFERSLPVAGETLKPALGLSDAQIAWMNFAFLLAYTCSQVPGGLLGQRLGARWTYVLVGAVGVLALLTLPLAPLLLSGTALYVALLAGQALLGVSQGPVFPVFAAVLERWFPQRQWALGNGLQAAGMNLGGAAIAPVIVALTAALGWRRALLSTALPVLLVTTLWAWYGRDRPQQHPRVSAAELAELGSAASEPTSRLTWRRLRGVLAYRAVWYSALSYLCMNYTFYLITVYSYRYFVEQRHLSGLDGGWAGMTPWLGAAIGASMGGWLSDRAAERLGGRWGYRLVPLLSLPLAGVLLLATTRVATPLAAVAILTLAFAAVEINEGPYWAAPMCVARGDTAAATGVLNTGGNAGGLLAVPIVDYLIDKAGWPVAFGSGAVFALIAACLWFAIDATERAPIRTEVMP